jgi:hypothetical protein
MSIFSGSAFIVNMTLFLEKNEVHHDQKVCHLGALVLVFRAAYETLQPDG